MYKSCGTVRIKPRTVRRISYRANVERTTRVEVPTDVVQGCVHHRVRYVEIAIHGIRDRFANLLLGQMIPELVREILRHHVEHFAPRGLVVLQIPTTHRRGLSNAL